MAAVLTFNPMDALTVNHWDYFVKEKDTLFQVDLGIQPDGSSGVIVIKGCWLVFNLAFWKPLLRRNMSIDKKRHLFFDEDFTTPVVMRIHTNILWDVIKRGEFSFNPSSGFSNITDVQSLRFELIESIEELYNFITTRLNNYTYTIDLFSIAETLTTPEAKALRNVVIPEGKHVGIKEIEAAFKAQFEKVSAYFSDPKTKPNVFFAPLRLGILNKTQFAQLVCGVGPRTDTDDSMILLPIRGSFMEGMEDIRAYAIESLAAKKSVHYNAEEMPFTQYTNRKQQLNSSAINRIYVGDCGTDVTVPFTIHREFAKNVLGKYINHEGKVIPLTAENIDQFIDKQVNMYSAMTCKHTDGFCHKCGGLLAQYFLPPTVIPGIIAGSEVMAPLAQQVLSNKHMATTFATIYCLPDELRSWMYNQDNNIYFTESSPFKDLMIGVPYSCVKRLSDLQYVEGDVRNDRYFSEVRGMMVANAHTGEIIMPLIELVDRYKTVPYFTGEFLETLRNHPEDMETSEDGNLVWIKLRHLDPSKPFMRAVMFNYSTRIFVAKIQNIFNSRITDFTSVTEYLETITNAIWTRIAPNILHLEVMGKASMISSTTNYDIPVVSDPFNVRFGRLDQLIPRRSIGTQMAFEQFFMWISNPSTFLLPKGDGPFDAQLGFVD